MANPIRGIYRTLLKPVYARLNAIEQQLQGQMQTQGALQMQMQTTLNRRFVALNRLREYLIVSEVTGDYLEFGVASGMTFAHACTTFGPEPFFRDTKFIAFDSFEGLPQPKGIDAVGGFTSHFHKAQYACSEADFVRNLNSAGVSMDRVKMVKGWFDESLTPENAEALGIRKVAVAWIDCDLYESTVPVLEFITPHLSSGSAVVFDDWSCFRNSPNFGEQRAFREWQDKNPQLSLHKLFSFGGHGMAFTVERSQP